MDCFTVSIACGISTRRIIYVPMLSMCLAFGLFQGGMTLLGYLGISAFSDTLSPIDHWIAFILLSYLGIRMIIDGFRKEEERTFNLLDPKVIVTMAIATSIDALAVGISIGCLYKEDVPLLWKAAGIIAFSSFLFTIFGLALGITIGKKTKWPAEVFGGIILILIGIKVLIEHLR